MRTARSLSLLVVLALLASMVLACATQPTAEPAKPGEEEEVTIRFISQYGVGNPVQEMWEAAGDEFMEENPNIKVDFDWAGGDFTSRWRAELAAGTPHDIIWHNEPTSHIFAREGVSLNLTDYLENTNNYEGDKTFKDSFIPAVLERAWVPDGADGAGYYAIPEAQYISGVFYNKALFEQFNIQIPKTWGEFLAVCETLKANDIAPITLAGLTSGYLAYWFQDLAIRTFSAEGFYDTAMNKPGTSFNDAGWLDIAKKIAELREKGYFIKGYEGTDGRSAQMLFVQGKAGMILMKAWLPAEMQLEAPEDFGWGFFNFPMVEGGKGEPTAVQLKYNGFVIAKDSKHPDEAVLFAKKLASTSVQKASVAVLRPAIVPGLEWPETLQGTYDVLMEAKKAVGFAADLDRDAAEWQAKVLRPLNDKLILGTLAPEDFIEQIQKEHEAFYAQKGS